MPQPRHGALIVVACTLLAATPAAAVPLTPPRAGQVGIGGQLGFGALFGGGAFAENIGGGASYAVHLRYRMRYERAIGLSFESTRYDVTNPTRLVPGADSTIAPERIMGTLSGLDVYQLFGTRTATVKMISLSAGIAQERVKLNDGEIELSGQFSGDAFFLGAGGAIERYVFRSTALDLSVRYHAIFREGTPHHDVQAALGVIIYAGY